MCGVPKNDDRTPFAFSIGLALSLAHVFLLFLSRVTARCSSIRTPGRHHEKSYRSA